MAKPSRMTLRLLGVFAAEANAGRAIAVCIRSKKARALLAYLAMKPDYRASREELATLLWGDNPDAQARHSLRQSISRLQKNAVSRPNFRIFAMVTKGQRGDQRRRRRGIDYLFASYPILQTDSSRCRE